MPRSGQPDTVVVIGLGVVGLSTALALARRGARVVGVDRFGSGHPMTSSTGISRSIRIAYAVPEYAALAAGADLRAPVRARSIDPAPHGVRVGTEAGSIDADRAVVAAGPWTAELVAPLGLRLPLSPAQMIDSTPRTSWAAANRAAQGRRERSYRAVWARPRTQRCDGSQPQPRRRPIPAPAA